MRGQQSTAITSSQNVIRTVKADSETADGSPMILLHRELEASNDEVDAGTTNRSLWSKLRTPTRFLLPRTDVNSATGTVMEPESELGLDDGF